MAMCMVWQYMGGCFDKVPKLSWAKGGSGDMKVSRRDFLRGLGVAGVVVAAKIVPIPASQQKHHTDWGTVLSDRGLSTGLGGFLVPPEYLAPLEEAIRGPGIIRGRPIRIPTTWELGDMVTLDDMEGR